MSSLRALKEQLAPIMDLQRVLRTLSCDQQTMKPAAGAGHRAEQTGTLQLLAHELFVADEARKDPQVVGDREEDLAVLTRQNGVRCPELALHSVPAQSPQPTNARCARGEELKATEFDCGASSCWIDGVQAIRVPRYRVD